MLVTCQVAVLGTSDTILYAFAVFTVEGAFVKCFGAEVLSPSFKDIMLMPNDELVVADFRRISVFSADFNTVVMSVLSPVATFALARCGNLLASLDGKPEQERVTFFR